MRKILAIILAVVMLGALAPSAFATEASGEGDRVSLVYDLGTLLNGYGSTISLSQLSTDSNGALRYVRSSLTTTTTVKDGVYATEAAASANTIKVAGVSPNLHFRIFGGRYICFEINIPKSGNYSLKVKAQKNKQGQPIKVYVTDAKTFYDQGVFGIAKLGEVAGNYDCYDANSSYTDISSGGNWEEMTVFEDKYIAAGRYVITFQGAGQSGVSSPRAPLGTFTLTGTPVAEETEDLNAITYNVAKIMKDNGIYYASGQNGAVEAEKITYEMTNGLFEVADARGNVTVGGNGATVHNFIKIAQNATVEFKVNIPEDGKYLLDANHQVAKEGAPVVVCADGERVGAYDCYSSESDAPAKFASGDTSVWKNNVRVSENAIELSAGEHIFMFTVQSSGYGIISCFELTNEELEGDSVSLVYVDKTTLEVDETTTISGAVVSSFDGAVKAESDANTVFTSSDSSVIRVDGKTITAVAPGKADVVTTVEGIAAKREITVLDEKVSGNVSLGVYSDVEGYVSVQVNGNNDDDIIKSVPRGSTVTITARTDDPAYIFRGWKRGSKDNGVWISDSAEISFPIMTNTFLTALYDPVAAEDVVNIEFYNYKGQYIETADDVGTKSFGEIKPKTEPTLTGYSAPFWTMDGKVQVSDDTVFTKLTRVVANYGSVEKYDIIIGSGISGAESGSYEYDSELVLNAENEGTWYVDGNPVAYGDSYLHCVWNKAKITFDENKTEAPIITLDAETKENGARMILYDANGANITEVGIIFGKNAVITSFDSKATSKKRGNAQGQFTAMPYDGDGTDARGYLIYKDGDVYRVIYAD